MRVLVMYEMFPEDNWFYIVEACEQQLELLEIAQDCMLGGADDVAVEEAILHLHELCETEWADCKVVSHLPVDLTGVDKFYKFGIFM